MAVPELILATLNIQGQTGFNEAKQKQIEHFIQHNNLDILHCQEINITDNTFKRCHYISSNFNIIQNNCPTNKYGTRSHVRRDL